MRRTRYFTALFLMTVGTVALMKEFGGSRKTCKCRLNVLLFLYMISLSSVVSVQDFGFLYPPIAEVFENETATLNFSTSIKDNYTTIWDATSDYSFVTVYPSQSASCAVIGFLANSTLYDVSCNQELVSVAIKNVKRYQHAQQWKFRLQFVSLTTNSTNNYSNVVTLKENDVIIITCSTSYVRPNASVCVQLSQYDGETLNCSTLSFSTNTTYAQNHEGLLKTVSTLGVITNKTLNGQRLRCIASNEPKETVASEAINFNILHPPSGPPAIHGFANGSKYSLLEHSLGYLLCSIGESNPRTILKWTCDHVAMLDIYTVNDTAQLLRFNASRYSNTKCTCNSQYQNGFHSSVFVIVDVLYPPQDFNVSLRSSTFDAINISINVIVLENTKLTFVCSADGNPSPVDYRWEGIYSSKTSELKFNSERFRSGNITCFASNKMTDISENKTTVGTTSKTYFVDVLNPSNIENIPDMLVIEGDDVDVLCPIILGKVTNHTVSWIANNGTEVNNGNLTIKNVKRHETGNYKCKLKYFMVPTYGYPINGSVWKHFNLEVLYPPENIQVNLSFGSFTAMNIPINITVLENTSMRFACTAKGNPSPVNYSWSWSGVYASNSSELFIHFERYKSGNMTCLAFNYMTDFKNNNTKIGITDKTYFVDVLYPPVIEEISNTSVVEGEDFTAACQVLKGKVTNHTVIWSSSNNLNVQSNSLLLRNISRYETGEYTCTLFYTMVPTYGSNLTGIQWQTFFLDVLYKAEISDVYVTHHKLDDIVVVNENDTVVLVCNAESNPKAVLELSFNGKVLSNSAETNVLYHTLNMSCTDSGPYTCSGNNTLNKDGRATKQLQLFVNCFPRPASSSAQEDQIISDLHVPVTLSFTVLAFPFPSFDWYREDGASLKEGVAEIANITAAKFRMDLTLKNITMSHYGQYLLLIRNALGSYLRRFNLKPLEKPTASSQLGYYGDSVTSSSATVWWERGFNGGSPQTFIVSYRILSSIVWTNSSSILDTDETKINATLAGLKSESQYMVWVYASNKVGTIRYLKEIVITTTAVESPTVRDHIARLSGIAGGSISAVTLAAIFVIIVVVKRRRTRLMKNTRKRKKESAIVNELITTDADASLGNQAVHHAPANVYETLQTNLGADNQYQHLSPNRQFNKGNHNVYEKLRV